MQAINSLHRVGNKYDKMLFMHAKLVILLPIFRAKNENFSHILGKDKKVISNIFEAKLRET